MEFQLKMSYLCIIFLFAKIWNGSIWPEHHMRVKELFFQWMLSPRVLCIWNAFIDRLPNPLRIWRKKNIFLHFSVKKGRVHTVKCPQLFLQYLRQSRPFNYWSLVSKPTEKTQIKSMTDHVRFNPFSWAFELVAPWLFGLTIYFNHSISLSWNRNCIWSPIQSQEVEHGAWLFKWRLIIQEFPLLKTSQEQQDSTACFSFFFIPSESVRSLKPLFEYNWNAHVVWSLAPSSKAERKYRTNITSDTLWVSRAISDMILISDKTNLFFVILIMHALWGSFMCVD